MIENPTAIWILCACAAILTAAAAAPFVFRHLTPAWRRATPFGRFLFCLAALALTLFAGPKTNSVGTAGGETNIVNGAGGVTNGVGSCGVMRASPRLMAFAPPRPNCDFELVRVTTNENPSFALPPDGRVRGTWHLTGAFDDVRDIPLDGFEFPLGSDLHSSFWAYTSGKIRPRLANASNEIAAVGAPMSALPGVSRLWTATGSNDTYLLTWENFSAGRVPLPVREDAVGAVNAQIELFPNGDFITRSNEVERLYRRHVPGIETEGYGPRQQLEVEENTNAYYTIDLVVSTADARVTFTGDGPSNLPDPSFIARADETNRVELLIGKTYAIRCDMPFSIIGASDWRVNVFPRSRTNATVVWPVDIYMDYGMPLLTGPLRAPLLGAPGGGPRLRVDPDWLNGTVSMPSNACCGVSGTGGEFAFSCANGDCGCGGCTISGSYAYEGYTITFGGWECGCVPRGEESGDYSTYGISLPEVVFKDGALRELNVWFDPGADDDNSGQLVLTPTQGQDKIRIWADEHRTAQASQFSWPVADGVSCTYYIEGVEASDSVDDIEFRLQWVKAADGPDPEYRQMTCAEVKETQVASLTSGITDGSPNPQPFAGHTNWNFNVTRSLNPDKHFAVLFRDVVNADFSVRDFSVRMTLVVQPTGAPVGTASWFALEPTPASGAIASTGAHIGELRNPKVGGVYHIGSCFDGSPTNECNIVLPLAGAEMYGILASDLGWADRFAATGRERLPKRWLERVKFGCKWFNWLENGFYRGRPDNHQHPTVWHYNQIRGFDGLGAVGTLIGHPIRVEKLSNFIAGYTCVKIGVPWHERVLAQAIGTTNDLAATLSWQAGEYVANNVSLDLAVSNLLTNAHLDSDEKTGKLWPNEAPVDNHRGYPGHGDFDREFSSPGFIYAQP